MNAHPMQPVAPDALNTQAAGPTEKELRAALARQSLLAFWGDLPELLNKHPRRWVAYSGRNRIGIGETRYELWQECERRGYKDGAFLICYIEAQDPAFVEAFDLPLPPEPE